MGCKTGTSEFHRMLAQTHLAHLAEADVYDWTTIDILCSIIVLPVSNIKKPRCASRIGHNGKDGTSLTKKGIFTSFWLPACSLQRVYLQWGEKLLNV